MPDSNSSMDTLYSLFSFLTYFVAKRVFLFLLFLRPWDCRCSRTSGQKSPAIPTQAPPHFGRSIFKYVRVDPCNKEPLGIGSGFGATLQVGHGGAFPSKNPQDTMSLMVKTKYKQTCNGPIFAGGPKSMQSKGLPSFVERLNRGVVD